MINYTEQLMDGLMPVQRDDPQAGQSAYYYFDPRYGDDDARHIVDVPDGTSPNPNAGAIQQYLYENDEYRYKNLYGNTPPPTQTAVSDYTVNTENLMGKPSSYFQDNNSADWSGNTAGIGVNPSYDTTPVLQNQTPTPWSGNYIPPNAYNSQPFSYQDMVPNAGRQIERRNLENELLMNGMDVLYGANRTLNGMSFGGLDWLGNKLGFDAQMNNYLQIKDPQSQNLAQAVGQLAELGGGALVGKKLKDVAQHGYNQFLRQNGRRSLINQLQRGNNFEDIRYSNITDSQMRQLNNIRKNINQPQMQNNRIIIPANVVKKWYEKRIINDGMSPEELANSIDNSIYSPNSVVFNTKYGQNQAIVNSSGNKLDIGFVSVNPSKPTQNVIKSDYQIKIDDLYKTLFGAK